MAKGQPTKAPAQRHTCPACGTVGSFRAGQAPVCKVCGTPVGGEVPTPPAALLSAPPPGRPLASAAPVRGEPPTALAAVALGCGILSFVTLWVTPVSILLVIAALACGIAALAQNEGDSGVQVMAGIGVGLAGVVLLLTWWAWTLHGFDDGGSSVEFSSSGQQEESGSGGNDGGSGGNGGGGSGGNDGGGSGGDGGDDGGSSGGGDTDAGGSGASDSGSVEVGGGVDAGDDVAAPMPVGILSGLGLLAAAAWRRRA